MNIDTRSQVLAEGDSKVWDRLADEIMSVSKINIVQLPTTSFVKMRARDSVEGITFSLGEILVTECEVELNKVRGWGYVMGGDPTKALAAATIDAALNAEHEMKDIILDAIRVQQEALNWQREIEYELVGRTKVTFKAMEGSR